MDRDEDGIQGKHGHEWVRRFGNILPNHEKCKWCGRVRIKYYAGGETKVLTKYKYKGGKTYCLSPKEKEEKRKWMEKEDELLKPYREELRKEREEGGSRKTVDVKSHIRKNKKGKPTRVKRHRRTKPKDVDIYG